MTSNAGCPFYSGGAIVMSCVDYGEMPVFANDTFASTSITANMNAYLSMSFAYNQISTSVTIKSNSYTVDYGTNNIRTN